MRYPEEKILFSYTQPIRSHDGYSFQSFSVYLEGRIRFAIVQRMTVASCLATSLNEILLIRLSILIMCFIQSHNFISD